jgi:ligand-binding sensor domain-containing protein
MHYSTPKLLVSTILSLLLFASCNGQLVTETAPIAPSKIVGYSKLLTSSTSTEADNVHAIIQDKKEFIWFATTNDDVYKYEGKTLVNFTTKDGLSSNCVFSMLQDDKGVIWFGTENGLTKYDGKLFIPVTMGNNSKYTINHILQDKKGAIWLATEQHGVYTYNGKTFAKFLDKQTVFNPMQFNPNMVTSLLEDTKGNIWMTTRADGIYKYNGTNLDNYKPNGLTWFYKIFEDKNGNIITSNIEGDGIYQFDGKTFQQQWQQLGLNKFALYSIIQDSKGNFWFGSEANEPTQRESTGGVWCYNGTSLTNYTLKDGLKNLGIFCVFADKNGTIWAGGRNTTLHRFDGKSFISYSK